MKSELAEEMGMRGEWVMLREFWDEQTKRYGRTEESLDGKTWGPWTDKHNTVSCRFVGGPKDGEVVF